MSSYTGPIGAAPPPPGEIPNFDNPRDAGHMFHMVYMILIQVVVVVFFALRVYVKFSVNGKFRLEDWSCLVGWIFTVLLNTTIFLKIHYGEGFHIWELTARNVAEIQKWQYISSLLFTPAALFTKAALLLLIVRIFSVERAVARRLHTLVVFFLVCYVPAQVAKTVVCIPVQAFWDRTISNFKCISQPKLFIYDSAVSIISDTIILVVPIVLTWKIRISTFKKAKIVGILGAGGVAVMVAIYRLYYLLRFKDSKDLTTYFIPPEWTVTGELAIGLICACLPSINFLLEQRAGSRVSSDTIRVSTSWWNQALKKYLDTVSTWSKSCYATLVAGRSTKQHSMSTADSIARLASTPEEERGEPQKSDYDVELAVLSASPVEPHPGELVLTGLGNRDESRLAPLPVIKRSSPFRISSPPG
ncbi:hypothetical protein EsH8_I_000534 [Colletotrichum jinshuiense]